MAGVFFLSGASDPFDPAVVRASMGGIFHLQLVRCTPLELRSWGDDHGVKLIGLSPRAPDLWTSSPAGEPLVLMVGEERHGLTPQTQALCDLSVCLPMSGRADSLNVGVATGVMLYELVRQAATPSTGG